MISYAIVRFQTYVYGGLVLVFSYLFHEFSLFISVRNFIERLDIISSGNVGFSFLGLLFVSIVNVLVVCVMSTGAHFIHVSCPSLVDNCMVVLNI